MSKTVSTFDRAAEDLSPPFNMYTGRDTSVYALTDFEPSKTSQEFAAESDVNNIMARYLKTGTVPMFVDRTLLDGDMHEMSYHEMMNSVADANSAFAALPAQVRAEFENDPAKFVAFALDEDNIPQLREWGMLSPEAIERLDAAEAARVAAAAEKPPADLAKPGKPGSKEAAPAAE